MGRKTDLAAQVEKLRQELAEARADIAALRAWMQGHTCAPQPVWPAPAQPYWQPPYTWISPVTTTAVSASGVNMTLRQVWPPKPDDPAMGVPALA